MKKEGISAAKLAATYIGVVVGAGFATGQEVLQFFSKFGISGIAGLLLATGLFVLFGFIIMDLGLRLNAKSHMEILRYAGGKYLGIFMDVLTTFFLFGALTAMMAGTGAIFEQQLTLPGFWGNLIMGVLACVTVMTGIRGIVNSISAVVPLLLLSVFGISLYALFTTPPNLTQAIESSGGLVSNWFLSAVLYVAYNTVISIAILGPLGLNARDRRAIKYGAVLGGVGLGFSLLMIYLALSASAPQIAGLEVPMASVAGRISPAVQLIYALVLISEIYTTAVGSLYGFTARFSGYKKFPLKENSLIIVTTAAALLGSQFGFSNLVKYLYPIVGYGGIALLLCLLFTEFRRKAARGAYGNYQGESSYRVSLGKRFWRIEHKKRR